MRVHNASPNVAGSSPVKTPSDKDRSKRGGGPDGPPPTAASRRRPFADIVLYTLSVAVTFNRMERCSGAWACAAAVLLALCVVVNGLGRHAPMKAVEPLTPQCVKYQEEKFSIICKGCEVSTKRFRMLEVP